MATLDGGLLRKLAEWSTDGLPVTSVYLDVDGRRYPRRVEYLVRVDDLLRKVENGDWPREHRRSIAADAERLRQFVDGFDRGGAARGLALFSCAAAGLGEEVTLPQPVRDRMVIGPRPHLLPLEALLESYERFCTALVDREKARIFMTVGGEVSEITDILDEVHRWHDQGGWAQARMQRHIREQIQRHLKHVAEVLLRQHQRRGFDHLILAGPEEVIPELERELHDYVGRTVVARVTLPMTASSNDVLELSLAVEEELHMRREREAVERLSSEVASATGRAVAGFDDTLSALEAGRVETLVIGFGQEASGLRCSACGHLAAVGDRCSVCGGELQHVPDLVEEAVESALRQRCRVETVQDASELVAVGGIGALLRF